MHLYNYIYFRFLGVKRLKNEIFYIFDMIQ